MSKVKSLEDVKKIGLFGNSNFDNIINNSMKVLQNNFELVSKRNMDICDTPISPMALDDDYTPVLFTSKVMLYYKKLVELINFPETAKEYSFVILGKSGTIGGEKCYLIDKIIDCNTHDENLSNRETKIDQEKLNQIVQYGLRNGYDFISIGHTHPNIPMDERKTTIANYLSNEIKENEFIRDAGLNLSLQDFISYDDLYQYFKNNPNIKTAQTIIMYNGEIAMISKNGAELSRSVILMDQSTGEDIYVSTKEEYNNKKQSL